MRHFERNNDLGLLDFLLRREWHAEREHANAARQTEYPRQSAEVVLRFLQFRGVGPKIATMATNILAREFKVPFADYYSVDVSADVHVRRVFHRLGLVRDSATLEDIIYCAVPCIRSSRDFSTFRPGRSAARGVVPAIRVAATVICSRSALPPQPWANQRLEATSAPGG